MDLSERFYERIKKRYGDVDMDALEAVLSPIVIPVKHIDKTIFKAEG